jgi:hypothetical protein
VIGQQFRHNAPDPTSRPINFLRLSAPTLFALFAATGELDPEIIYAEVLNRPGFAGGSNS